MKLPVGRIAPYAASALMLAAVLATPFSPLQAGRDHNYVGARICGSCHAAQYEAWKKDPHSRSLDALDAAHASDPKCLECHGEADAPGVKSVQCESCHGAGRLYAPSFIMQDKPAAEALGLKAADFSVCLQCHRGDHPTIRKFDAARDWENLPHSKTGDKSDKKKGS